VLTSGVLRDELGKPIAGGQVQAQRRNAPQGEPAAVALTDAEGRFELRVPPGEYALVARLEQRKTAAAAFALPHAAGITLRLFRDEPSGGPASAEELEFVRRGARGRGL
jgi:hypothetical protein